MADIRKHGFESDAQWREYLEEIDEPATRSVSRPRDTQADLDILAAMRAEVADMHQRIRVQRGQHTTRWWKIAGASVLLAIAAMQVDKRRPRPFSGLLDSQRRICKATIAIRYASPF